MIIVTFEHAFTKFYYNIVSVTMDPKDMGLSIGSQNQKLCGLHEKCRSVGQNQQNFILNDKIFYSVRQLSDKNYHNYNDNI